MKFLGLVLINVVFASFAHANEGDVYATCQGKNNVAVQVTEIKSMAFVNINLTRAGTKQEPVFARREVFGSDRLVYAGDTATLNIHGIGPTGAETPLKAELTLTNGHHTEVIALSCTGPDLLEIKRY